MPAVNTGDLVMVRAIHPGWVGRTIRAVTGAVHEHDELIRVDHCGVARTLWARPPAASYLPLAERIAQHERREIVFGIFRLACFSGIGSEHMLDYQFWKARVAAQLDLLNALRVPYDVQAIISQGRNWVRERLPWLRPVLGHSEHRVYCTESCELVTRLAGLSLYLPLPPQRFYAPIHSERVWRCGHLALVQDYGLMEHLQESTQSQDIVSEGGTKARAATIWACVRAFGPRRRLSSSCMEQPVSRT